MPSLHAVVQSRGLIGKEHLQCSAVVFVPKGFLFPFCSLYFVPTYPDQLCYPLILRLTH